MAEQKHEHGKMDISEQEKTFNGFVRWSVWGAAISIGVLIFLALANS
ncbi:MAG: aa3-type cytochrome c oxidase subunit IV [Roseinatronobacter sp.]|uniref:Aa3 type cytochrome c oxidase subunit IV n=1 Tax=Roseinatronobacter monicus TaxID=393481 RepID=A0A543KEN9_9RHOB|nr:aa3-type cytochrome c oxidase subunit IV [Roseinatronobacter monicus]TQM93487.1 aa3 type cytochrome c oxidase subunit IV [Roseinatronobacter monicus]TVP98244.1 MAG: aa3-type cytochrome c oxidase subunit IV [Roseinatronobacter sp.]